MASRRHSGHTSGGPGVKHGVAPTVSTHGRFTKKRSNVGRGVNRKGKRS